MAEPRAGRSFLAIDLGAESGRAVIGSLDDIRLTIREVHRFPNGPIRVGDHIFWDVLSLWSEIKHGLGLAARDSGGSLVSLGLDTWGVDYGLLAADDTLLGNPYHYRDHRTDGMMERVFERVPRAEVYERTGIQFMQLNTLYQLYAEVLAGSPALSIAQTLLMMPDLFNFWLTGRKVNEFTIATTSQCYDTRGGRWATELLYELGIPTRLFGEVVAPGTTIGPLRSSVAEEMRASGLTVVAAGSHDTASAVAAVPAERPDYIYLSSGTWSLMGVETPAPIVNARSLAADMTNEGGVAGAFRFLKNIMGLWLLQGCRRQWAAEGAELGYGELTDLAAAAPAFGPLVFPGDGRFLAPADMCAAIRDFCAATGQPPPQTRGEMVRCVLESLALEYRWVAEQLDQLVGRRLPVIHIIGGGSQNQLLDQFAADATGRAVVAGPVEATAIGNMLVQAIATGDLGSIADARALVRRSFALTTFEPRERAAWDAAYGRYLEVRARSC